MLIMIRASKIRRLSIVIWNLIYSRAIAFPFVRLVLDSYGRVVHAGFIYRNLKNILKILAYSLVYEDLTDVF